VTKEEKIVHASLVHQALENINKGIMRGRMSLAKDIIKAIDINAPIGIIRTLLQGIATNNSTMVDEANKEYDEMVNELNQIEEDNNDDGIKG